MRIALFVLTVIMLIGIAACIEPIPSDPEPFCGDGVIDAGESCDSGSANTDMACDPSYGESCSYCTSSCERVVVEGASCGDGTCQAEESYDSCSTDCEADVPFGSFRGDYYTGTFDELVDTRVDETIDFDWGHGSPMTGIGEDNFSVRWTGRFSFDEGEYAFTARVDDGVRISVDGEVVLESWQNQPFTTYTETVPLSAGDHAVVVEYYESHADAGVSVSWQKQVSPLPDPGLNIEGDYYVSTTGSDSNDGRKRETAFATIDRADDVVEPGDTVVVLDGTYSGSVRTSTDGRAGERITFRSDTKHGARIDATGYYTGWRSDGDYVDVVDFEVTGADYLGIVTYGSHVRVIGNHVYDLKPTECHSNGGAGIDITNYDARNGSMIGNIVHGIQLPEGALAPGERCPRIHGLYHAIPEGYIANNIVYDVVGWGIHTWHYPTDLTIVNNLVFDTSVAIGLAGDEIPLSNSIVANNIAIDNRYGIYNYNNMGENNRYVNNLVWNNDDDVSLTYGDETDEGTIYADPGFVDYRRDGSGDYRLASGSPAIDAGTSLEAPDDDIDGNPRPVGSGYDIGPYEYQSSGSEQVEGDYYVSTTGSDSNTGRTRETAFATIDRADDVVEPGDTVIVLDGTYGGSGGTSQAVHTTTDARAGERIVYRSENPWGAKIIADGYYRGWRNDGEYVDIVGFEVTGSDYVGIDNRASYARMIGNYVHDLNPTECTSNGGAGINNGNYDSRGSQMIGNVVHGIQMADGEYCNLIHGLYHSVPDGYLANNIVYDVVARGIQMWHVATNVTVANNLVFDTDTGILLGGGDVVMDNSEVVNNIVLDTRLGIRNSGSIGNNNRYENNLVWNTNNPFYFRAADETATGTVSADPGLVDYRIDGSGDYRLASGSPAIDAGTSLEAPDDDIDGNPRPAGSGYDIGPYEYQP